MSFIKYSIGGKIISVSDENSIEEREVIQEEATTIGKIAICMKCGLQHLTDGEKVCNCGGRITLN